MFLLFLFWGLGPPHPPFMFLFYFLIMYETLDCFIYFGGLCPPHPHLCLNFIFKILLNHYNVSFNSVGSASYIYNFMMVINWHLYFYYILGKRSPMMPKENKVTNEFKDFLCIRKRVLLGCCIPNFIILFALIKISEI